MKGTTPVQCLLLLVSLVLVLALLPFDWPLLLSFLRVMGLPL